MPGFFDAPPVTRMRLGRLADEGRMQAHRQRLRLDDGAGRRGRVLARDEVGRSEPALGAGAGRRGVISGTK